MAAKDANRVTALQITSNADGLAVMSVYAVSNKLKVEIGATGSSFTSVNAQRDADRIPVMWATSSTDGKTPIPIYGNPVTNAMLIKNT